MCREGEFVCVCLGLFLPVTSCLRCGKCHYSISWLARPVFVLACVCREGFCGAGVFRKAFPHGTVVAKLTCWFVADEMSVQANVYEDPVFTGTTRVTSVDVDTFFAPGFAQNLSGHEQGGMEHWYERLPGGQAMYTWGHGTGLWWPVWLVARTKGGWWTICWFQLIDGGRVVEFWWYTDVHVHLLDSVR